MKTLAVSMVTLQTLATCAVLYLSRFVSNLQLGISFIARLTETVEENFLSSTRVDTPQNKQNWYKILYRYATSSSEGRSQFLTASFC